MGDAQFGGLITIGALARASGLTASALRFYDDCGLLVPARVDEVTGYRYYAGPQCARAVLIRRLRGIGVPLEAVSGILDGDAERAAELLDTHVAELERGAREAALVARAIKDGLGANSGKVVVLPGAVLARAIDQVWPAAARIAEIPVLGGVLVEATENSLMLTATDRYRLSTRTVVPQRTSGEDWSLVVEAGTLAALSTWLRAVTEIVLTPDVGALVVRGGDIERGCRVIDAAFPDYRVMLAGLAPVRTRAVVARDALLGATEGTGGPMGFSIDETGITLSTPHLRDRRHRLPNIPQEQQAAKRIWAQDEHSTQQTHTVNAGARTFARVPDDSTARRTSTAVPNPQVTRKLLVSPPSGHTVRRLSATVTGTAIDLTFDPATLRPAILTALGPDIMLDISAPDQPVVVRSATDGDLTTLAMPCRFAE